MSRVVSDSSKMDNESRGRCAYSCWGEELEGPQNDLKPVMAYVNQATGCDSTTVAGSAECSESTGKGMFSGEARS